MIDSAAAMRYTNCGLSHYGWSFFDSDYIAKEVTSFVPNYDDTTIEPVSLPALLPNVLLNGGEGIGVGTTTCLPTFTPESVVEVITRVLKGEKLQPIDYAKTLKFANVWGGQLVKTRENRKAWLDMFTTSQARVVFESKLVIDRESKAIEINDWAPGINVEKFMTKVRAFPETDQAVNHSGATGWRVEMRRDYNYAQFDKFVEKVRRATQVRRSFKINVTHRKSTINDGIVSFETKYLSLSVPQLLIAWLRERLALEKRSLEYRIVKQEKAIAYTELLIFASTKVDIIADGLKTDDPKAYIIKHLKITPEQADQILHLQVIQLSKLDRDKMKIKVADQRELLKQLNVWFAKPRPKVIADTATVMAAIEKDRKFQLSKNRTMALK